MGSLKFQVSPIYNKIPSKTTEKNILYEYYQKSIINRANQNRKSSRKAKHMKGITDKIIIFFEKTKVFGRKLQISKRNLSPNRIIKQGRNKRKNSTNIKMNANKRMLY